MSLSKIHRADEIGDFQQFQFTDFDGGVKQAAGSDIQSGPLPTEVPLPSGDDSASAFTRGRQEGRQEAGDQLDHAAQALARGLEEISRLRESILKASTQDMLRLVLTITRQLIHREVTADSEVILKTIDMALQASVAADNYQILVNPDDLAQVEARKPLFLASITGVENICFRSSPDIERGGCLVESDLGQVDATIAGQLEEVRKTLLGSLAED